MIKTYSQAVKFLESYIPTPEKKHPGKLGIERMQYLVELLENPQFSYPTIHVGGTSGKGSTATIIASILSTKYKVGLHTSPHLEKITERIKIFSRGPLAEIARSPLMKDISDKEFVEMVNEIMPAIKKVEESKLGTPSYFEIVAALAFLYFKKQKVDMAVIEVGMGGRYDATNVIKPRVAVITNVGLDHTEVLGDTVEKIARDKAGIIKGGIQVVSGVTQPAVMRIVKDACKKNNASLSIISRGPLAISARGPLIKYKIRKMDETGSVFDYYGSHTYTNLRLSLLGEHQIENAAIAIRTIEISRPPLAISARGGLIKEKDIRKGLSNAFIPGRLEVINRRPLVILDGAHNPDKVKALVRAIRSLFPKQKGIVVLAIKNDKNAKDMLRNLLPVCSQLILTKFHLTTDAGDTFSYTPVELVRIARRLISRAPLAISARGALIKNDPIHAVREAIKSAKADDFILVTGSLYLVGEVRKFLIDL